MTSGAGGVQMDTARGRLAFAFPVSGAAWTRRTGRSVSGGPCHSDTAAGPTGRRTWTWRAVLALCWVTAGPCLLQSCHLCTTWALAPPHRAARTSESFSTLCSQEPAPSPSNQLSRGNHLPLLVCRVRLLKKNKLLPKTTGVWEKEFAPAII